MGKSLDLAFAMDTTGSMCSYIDSARDNIRQITEEIVATEGVNVRLALVNYKDHPPQDSTYVTEVHDFTSSAYTMKNWLSSTSATGGGDEPEAVADALYDALHLTWRTEATKVCVCISDAPPHGIGCSGDGFPNGCPAGHDPMQIAGKMAEKGITLYAVGCEPSITEYKSFFMALAFKTGGQYIPLGNARSLTQVIIGGVREEIDHERLMHEVDTEVEADLAAGRTIDEMEMARRLHAKMTAKGVTTKQLHRNKAELESAVENPAVSAMSKLSTIGEVKDFKVNVESGGGLSGAAGALPLTGALSRLTVKDRETTAMEECYEVEEKPVTVAVTSRLVKKSLARNMINKK